PRSFSSLPPPRPPHSTLFPYTTLFRSLRSDNAQRLGPERDRCRSDHRDGHRLHQLFEAAVRSHRMIARPQSTPLDPRSREAAAQDRKSTRLNSSHVSISYAVFCLKKKT